jgi:hypothetical protein
MTENASHAPQESYATPIPETPAPQGLAVAAAPKRRNSPMAWAAMKLSAVCDDIDNADEIDTFLQEALAEAALDLGEKADRRIALDRWIQAQLDAVDDTVEFMQARAATLNHARKRLKADTKAIMEADPGIKERFRGRLGKISLCQNSAPSISYAWGDKAITPEAAAMLGVPDDYIVTKTIHLIDTDRVRAELMAGQTLEWATATYGTHVRFPRKTKNTLPLVDDGGEQ